MAVVLPDWLDTALDIVGIAWPNVDEDAYRDMATSLREFADDMDEDSHSAHGPVQRLLSSGSGEALTALDKHWVKVRSKQDDIAGAARLVADALDKAAGVIEGMKYACLGHLSAMIAQAGISLAAAPFTFGLSTLISAGTVAATRTLVRKLIKEAGEEAVGYVMTALTEPAVRAIENVAADLAVQIGANALGLQNGIDTGQAVQAGRDGLEDGVAAGKESLQLASAGTGTGPGSLGGLIDSLNIDHGEHGRASGKLVTVSDSVKGRTKGKLSKAGDHHSRTRGRDSIAQIIDPIADRALKTLNKATDDLGGHLGGGLSTGIKKTSTDQKSVDLAVHDRIKRIDSGAAKDGDGGRGSGSGSGTSGQGPAPASGRKPASGGNPDPGRNPDPAMKIDSATLSQRARELDNKETCGDPIDMATGQMILAQTDVELPGVLPLLLRRTHLSGCTTGSSFGPSWACTLDERLERDEALGGLWWYREDGSALAYPRVPDVPGDRVSPAEGARLPLTYITRNAGYVLTVRDPRTGLTRHFEPGTARDEVWWLVSLEDRNGNSVTIERDEHDVPLTVSHSGGYRIQIHSDTEHRRVVGLSALGTGTPTRLRTFDYDDTGNLTQVHNAVHATTRFSYDDAHRLTGWRDSNDSEFSYTYDNAGRVVATRGTDGILDSTVSYSGPHSDGTSTVTYTDSLGHATVHRSNRHGQIIAITDPLGHTTTQRWDRHDHLLAHTDPLGRTTRWEWDADGNLTAVTAPDGSVTRVTYGTGHLPTLLTGPDGAETRQEYDERGNRTAVTGPDHATVRFTYHSTGALESQTDPLGQVLRLENDAAGLPVAVKDARGARTSCRRDTLGRPVELTNALGGTSGLTWDTEGRLVSRTAPDGSRETWEWDGEGNCLTHTDPLGGSTTSTYGPFDLLATRTTPDNRTHTFRHDTEQRLVQVVNPAGLTWNYRFDPVGRVAAETDFDDRTTTCAYDPAGQPARRTNAAGESVDYAFDTNGRLAAKTAGETRTSFSYDPASRLTAAASPGCRLEFSYDIAGRLLTQTVDGATLTLGYDPAGRRISRTTPTGARTSLTWDEVGNRSGLALDDRHTLSFGHDLLGRETERAIGNHLDLASSWDSVGRLTRQHLTTRPGRRIRARGYTYRADDHLIAVHEEVTGRGTSYDLDRTGRPLRATGPAGPEAYTYDASGNQLTAHWPDRSADPSARGERHYNGTRVTHAGDTRYRYDGAGRLVERVKKRLSRKPDVWRYAWDAENRLTSCITPDGATWHYRYDPLGRRTAKHRLDDAGQIVDTVRFTWDGTRLAEQTTNATGATLTWEHDGHRPLVQYERKPLPDEEVDSRFFAIVSDVVGTPTELVAADGTIAWHTRTTVWGTTAVNPDATAHTPLRHPGQYADPETGLHYNYFRHYDPETARYVSPDPLGLLPAPNPVAYVDNPLDLYDPLGLAPCRKDHYAHGGSVRYKGLDHLGRPTGVSASVRPAMLHQGTEAGRSTPPGWRGEGRAFNEARGHLLADRLGGAGTHHNAKHNLVTQTQDPTNSPYQRDLIEGEIYKAVKRGEVVQYDITPIYEGTNPIPIRVEYAAHGNRGFELTGWLDNPAAGVRTAVPGWKP